MATPIIPQRYVYELAAGILSHDVRRVGEGKASFFRMAAQYREAGLSPHRFRADVCRASMPNAWMRDLTDAVPGVTDEAIDTMRRRAIKRVASRDHWAATQPLARK